MTRASNFIRVKIPVKDGASDSQGRPRIQCQPPVLSLASKWDRRWNFRVGGHICVDTYRHLEVDKWQ